MRRALIATVLTLALVAAACGDDSTTAASTTTTAASGSTTTTAPPAPLEKVRITHPETLAFAAPFTFVNADGALGAVADEVSASTWATPDVLRAQLVNGEAEVAAVPTYVGANLFNKGVDVRMVAVVVWGLLWVVGPDGQAGDWDALRGQTVMVPFPNDMPDLVFQYLAKANGLTPGVDFQVEHYAQPLELVGRLVQGAGTWAVLPEHVATIAVNQAKQSGRSIGRALDLQAEWGTATGEGTKIPQAGIVMPGKLVDERPDVVAAVLTELERTVALVNAKSAETVAALAAASSLPEPVVGDVIPRLNLDVVSGGDAKPALERFFRELASLSPDIIGGQLPAAGFYVDDPR